MLFRSARVAGGEEQGAVRRGENGSGSPEKKQGRRGRSSDGSPRVEQGAAPPRIEQRRPARGGAGRRSAGERAAAAQRRWFCGSAGRIWDRWIEKNIEVIDFVEQTDLGTDPTQRPAAQPHLAKKTALTSGPQN